MSERVSSARSMAGSYAGHGARMHACTSSGSLGNKSNSHAHRTHGADKAKKDKTTTTTTVTAATTTATASSSSSSSLSLSPSSDVSGGQTTCALPRSTREGQRRGVHARRRTRSRHGTHTTDAVARDVHTDKAVVLVTSAADAAPRTRSNSNSHLSTVSSSSPSAAPLLMLPPQQQTQVHVQVQQQQQQCPHAESCRATTGTVVDSGPAPPTPLAVSPLESPATTTTTTASATTATATSTTTTTAASPTTTTDLTIGDARLPSSDTAGRLCRADDAVSQAQHTDDTPQPPQRHASLSSPPPPPPLPAAAYAYNHTTTTNDDEDDDYSDERHMTRLAATAPWYAPHDATDVLSLLSPATAPTTTATTTTAATVQPAGTATTTTSGGDSAVVPWYNTLPCSNTHTTSTAASSPRHDAMLQLTTMHSPVDGAALGDADGGGGADALQLLALQQQQQQQQQQQRRWHACCASASEYDALCVGEGDVAVDARHAMHARTFSAPTSATVLHPSSMTITDTTTTAGARQQQQQQQHARMRSSSDKTAATHDGSGSSNNGGGGEPGSHSQTNLFVRNLPHVVTDEQLRKMFAPFGTIMTSAIMRNIHTGVSLGMAFVRYETHDEARAAMEHFTARRRVSGSRPISVQWARKEHDRAPAGEARQRMKKLFVRNIPRQVTQEALEELFAPYGPIKSISLHRDTIARSSGGNNGGAVASATAEERRIAFVTYAIEGVADKAAAAVHNTTPFAACQGIPLMVKLAEDVPLRHMQQQQQQQQHASQHTPLVSSSSTYAQPPQSSPLHPLHHPHHHRSVSQRTNSLSSTLVSIASVDTGNSAVYSSLGNTMTLYGHGGGGGGNSCQAQHYTTAAAAAATAASSGNVLHSAGSHMGVVMASGSCSSPYAAPLPYAYEPDMTTGDGNNGLPHHNNNSGNRSYPHDDVRDMYMPHDDTAGNVHVLREAQAYYAYDALQQTSQQQQQQQTPLQSQHYHDVAESMHAYQQQQQQQQQQRASHEYYYQHQQHHALLVKANSTPLPLTYDYGNMSGGSSGGDGGSAGRRVYTQARYSEPPRGGAAVVYAAQRDTNTRRASDGEVLGGQAARGNDARAYAQAMRAYGDAVHDATVGYAAAHVPSPPCSSWRAASPLALAHDDHGGGGSGERGSGGGGGSGERGIYAASAAAAAAAAAAWSQQQQLNNEGGTACCAFTLPPRTSGDLFAAAAPLLTDARVLDTSSRDDGTRIVATSLLPQLAVGDGAVTATAAAAVVMRGCYTAQSHSARNSGACEQPPWSSSSPTARATTTTAAATTGAAAASMAVQRCTHEVPAWRSSATSVAAAANEQLSLRATDMAVLRGYDECHQHISNNSNNSNVAARHYGHNGGPGHCSVADSSTSNGSGSRSSNGGLSDALMRSGTYTSSSTTMTLATTTQHAASVFSMSTASLTPTTTMAAMHLPLSSSSPQQQQQQQQTQQMTSERYMRGRMAATPADVAAYTLMDDAEWPTATTTAATAATAAAPPSSLATHNAEHEPPAGVHDEQKQQQCLYTPLGNGVYSVAADYMWQQQQQQQQQQQYAAFAGGDCPRSVSSSGNSSSKHEQVTHTNGAEADVVVGGGCASGMVDGALCGGQRHARVGSVVDVCAAGLACNTDVRASDVTLHSHQRQHSNSSCHEDKDNDNDDDEEDVLALLNELIRA